MSGHSKWNNIKNKKGKEDAKKGRVFTKMARYIMVAAREEWRREEEVHLYAGAGE